MLLKTRDAGASRVAAKKRLRARRVAHAKARPVGDAVAARRGARRSLSSPQAAW